MVSVPAIPGGLGGGVRWFLANCGRGIRCSVLFSLVGLWCRFCWLGVLVVGVGCGLVSWSVGLWQIAGMCAELRWLVCAARPGVGMALPGGS